MAPSVTERRCATEEYLLNLTYVMLSALELRELSPQVPADLLLGAWHMPHSPGDMRRAWPSGHSPSPTSPPAWPHPVRGISATEMTTTRGTTARKETRTMTSETLFERPKRRTFLDDLPWSEFI